MMHNGLFISFEGPEGSGKTTIIKLLKEKLENLISSKSINYSNVLSTREPGGTNNPLAENIRNIILDPTNLKIPNITEAFLFAASRSVHVENTIKPFLDKNGIVLSDRYLDSSIIYQGVGKNIGINKILEINKYATNGLLPDITFYFDLDPIIGLNRIKNNKRETNRFDNVSLQDHIKIANAYKQYLTNIKRVCFVDANQSIDKIVDFCLNKIFNFIKDNNDKSTNHI